MAEGRGDRVVLHVYDLSQGLARQLSGTFLGKVIDGIWHTGIVVYGKEYWYGGGIQSAAPGHSPYGRPVQTVTLGYTQVPEELFREFLAEMSERYTPEAYNLMSHNCNNFSDEVANLLVGRGIPDYIVGLPQEVLDSPMGALIAPMIQQLETTLRYNGVPQPPQMMVRPAASGMMPAGGQGVRNVPLSRATTSTNQDPRIRQAAENRLAAAGGRLSAEQGAEAPRVAAPSSVSGNAATAKAVGVSSPQSPDVPKVDSNKVRGTAAGAAEASAPVEQGRAEASASESAPKKTAGSEASRSKNGGRSPAPVDPLGGARAIVQEEITREFSRLMADGGLAANEAAVLAMRHVMARHGLASNSPRTRA
ncbi:hypothetical protein CBR_g567 [Chara braunii]|uniref:PPPDE domain-containing protein n=1 Tax=Chara braunii TaxID=69332 RepID=A0A388KBJ1_CHABU|nr:hypothetical protein CBR_g567 [Chara braunii]|eukprot:GBG67432.1 hypothetical protein CBR_g567 [Chara braunii]